ncbi:MAG: IreB family regulatory phosphoprotein [Clostridia bacterium]|nr:IreB family regulatory phosphoprotein [Clostridia bacterium]MBP5729838.1 IreB family regulatory phosphoprotein [Clostridia bacterium]
MESSGTIFFSKINERQRLIKSILNDVYDALSEKGYNPISQLVGYVMSGDPTYITNHNGARSKITRIERDEIVEELFNVYIACEARNKGAKTN